MFLHYLQICLFLKKSPLQKAAVKGITQVVVSRITMAAPGMSMQIKKIPLYKLSFYLNTLKFSQQLTCHSSFVSHPPHHHAEAGKIQVHAG